MKNICLSISLCVLSIPALAGIPVIDITSATFEATPETAVGLEAGKPAVFISSNKQCRFLGETREENKTGFFNELFERKNYFVDVSTAVCDDIQVDFDKVTIGYETAIKPGEVVRLPFIEALHEIAPSLAAPNEK